MPVRPRDDDAAQPHDRLVKFAFSRHEHAVGLLKAVLSPGVTEAIAWDTLRLESGSHVEPSLRSRHVDLQLRERLRAELAPHVPSFEMAVVDLSPGQATRIVERMLTGFGRMVLFCLSAAGNDDRLEQGIHRMTEALDALLRYLLATHREMTPSEIVDLLEATGSGKQRKVIMDELDVFRVEGRKEGRVEGRQEGAAKVLLRQLKARFGAVPPDARARILAAKEATLARWSLRVLTAPTLDAVLGGKAKKAPARRPAARRRARAA